MNHLHYIFTVSSLKINSTCLVKSIFMGFQNAQEHILAHWIQIHPTVVWRDNGGKLRNRDIINIFCAEWQKELLKIN